MEEYFGNLFLHSKIKTADDIFSSATLDWLCKELRRKGYGNYIWECGKCYIKDMFEYLLATRDAEPFVSLFETILKHPAFSITEDFKNIQLNLKSFEFTKEDMIPFGLLAIMENIDITKINVSNSEEARIISNIKQIVQDLLKPYAYKQTIRMFMHIRTGTRIKTVLKEPQLELLFKCINLEDSLMKRGITKLQTGQRHSGRKLVKYFLQVSYLLLRQKRMKRDDAFHCVSNVHFMFDWSKTAYSKESLDRNRTNIDKTGFKKTINNLLKVARTYIKLYPNDRWFKSCYSEIKLKRDRLVRFVNSLLKIGKKPSRQLKS